MNVLCKPMARDFYSYMARDIDRIFFVGSYVDGSGLRLIVRFDGGIESTRFR